jgi:GTP-binding protein
MVVHVVDASRDDALADIATIDAELEAYGHGLRERPEIIALNKIDLAEARDRVPALVNALEARGREALALSAATGEGVDRLAKRLFTLTPPRAVPQAAPSERRIVFKGSARDVSVLREGASFRVRGDRIERLASGIDWDSGEASAYFHRMLQRNGVERRLRELGVKEGDTVKIGRLELEWKDDQ